MNMSNGPKPRLKANLVLGLFVEVGVAVRLSDWETAPIQET